jgi:DNA-binding beta-propeller fold protein YncE
MDETSLRALFDRAVSSRPPAPHLVANARRAGLRLRKRRRIEAAAASVTAVALIAAIPTAAGVLGRARASHEPAADSWTPATAPNAYVWTNANTVTPIRLSTDTTWRPLRFPGVIAGLQVAPDGSAVYVFSAMPPGKHAAGTTYITRVSASTGRVGAPVRLIGPLSAWLGWQGNAAMTAEIAPGDRFAYASGLTSGLVAINLATGVERKIAVYGPFAMTPDGQKAYITDVGLIPVDLAKGEALPAVRLNVPGPTQHVAITPDGKTAYVTNIETSGTVNEHITTWVTPVNVATDTAGRAFVGRSVNSQLLSGNISIAPDGATGYLWGTDVIPMDLATSQVEKPIRLDAAIAAVVSNFVISPDSRIAYAQLVGQRWLQPVDLVSDTALRPVELPAGFAGTAAVTFSKDGTVAYVGATARQHGRTVGAVIPIEAASERVGPPIPLQGSPEQILVVP